ncbi:MAG: hypothetical protein R2941_03575 [Desulfobacterales bacterium]
MAELSTITAKIDPKLKAEAESIFHEMNLSLNEAINLFFCSGEILQSFAVRVRNTQ